MRWLRTGLAASVMSLALALTACSGGEDDVSDLNPDQPAEAPEDDDAVDAGPVADDPTEESPEPEPTETEQEMQDLPDDGQAYTVEAGDTLSGIAERFDLTTTELIEANDLTDPDRLAPGDELIIPGSGTAADEDDGDDDG